jgi:glyoxylase-like metal-dependent hydrolase (beta-lactamase superfamily II)
MRIYTVPVGPFEMNCYLVADDHNPQCLVIDPGDETQRLIDIIEQNNLKPERIINTHNHVDHLLRVAEFKKHYKISFHICEKDLPLLESLQEQALLFGLDETEIPVVDSFVKDGDQFNLGDLNYSICETPGHSPGSICILFPGHVFVGDVLFQDSIGRTDLYQGDYNQLIRSIKEKLLVLPDETIVYPGHGPTTTIGQEKRYNPFLK